MTDREMPASYPDSAERWKNDPMRRQGHFESRTFNALSIPQAVYETARTVYEAAHSHEAALWTRAVFINPQRPDNYTWEHSERVSLLATALAVGLQRFPDEEARVTLSDEAVRMTALAGLVHDMGKADEAVQGVLYLPHWNLRQRHTVQQHPEKGLAIVQQQGLYLPPDVLYALVYHHACKQVGAYPSNPAIVPPGQYGILINHLIAIADVYDAVRSKRPYRDDILPLLEALVKTAAELDIPRAVLRQLARYAGHGATDAL